jgi:tetratricopeptide (TPR) repeat protein
MARTFGHALLIAAAFVVAHRSSAADAFAQAPRPKPNPVQLDEGRRHFAQGVALYQEGNFPAALAEFQAAYDVAPAASILYNIGLTQKALFHYSEAITALERYLNEGPREGRIKPDRRKEVAEVIEGMKALLAPVSFALRPATATLTIDGRATALPDSHTLSLPAGNHVAVVSADDHEPQRREFSVVAAQPQLVAVELKAIPRTGRVRITSSQPGTAVEVDGQGRGFAPLELELGPGGHQLLARREGFEPYRAEVMLAAGQTRNIDLELQRPAPPPTLAAASPAAPVYKRWWFWTAIGTAVAAGTVTALALRPGIDSPLSGPLGTTKVDLKGAR